MFLGYSVEGFLQLQFMVHVMLFRKLNMFCTSTSILLEGCGAPSMAVLCSSLLSGFPVIIIIIVIIILIIIIIIIIVGRDSAVGIATCYGLHDRGIESQWEGEIFPTRPDWP
jgi:hypothetical protein